MATEGRKTKKPEHMSFESDGTNVGTRTSGPSQVPEPPPPPPPPPVRPRPPKERTKPTIREIVNTSVVFPNQMEDILPRINSAVSRKIKGANKKPRTKSRAHHQPKRFNPNAIQPLHRLENGLSDTTEEFESTDEDDDSPKKKAKATYKSETMRILESKPAYILRTGRRSIPFDQPAYPVGAARMQMAHHKKYEEMAAKFNLALENVDDDDAGGTFNLIKEDKHAAIQIPQTEHRTYFDLNDRIKLYRKLGSGSFGEVYAGIYTPTNEKVAVKVERKRKNHPQLYIEAHVLNRLQGPGVGNGIPKFVWYGQNTMFNILVMQRLGNSLEDLLRMSRMGCFTLKTVLIIADQLLSRVEHLHSKDYIHRDIKPQNIVIGMGTDAHVIYLIDYGLAKKFRDRLPDSSGTHIPYSEGHKLTGTARYASMRATEGSEQSRRDDLEALGLCLIYFLKGSLPWQGTRASNKNETYRRIADKKSLGSIEQLCYGLPQEIFDFVKYSRSLAFEEDPDYLYLRNMLRSLFNRSRFTYDSDMDWIVDKRERNRTDSSEDRLPVYDEEGEQIPREPQPTQTQVHPEEGE